MQVIELADEDVVELRFKGVSITIEASGEVPGEPAFLIAAKNGAKADIAATEEELPELRVDAASVHIYPQSFVK